MRQAALSYAVRPRVIIKYTGQLCLVAAVLTAVPLAASVWWGDYHISLRYGAVAVGLGLAGGLASRLRPPRQMQQNEALVVAATAFLLMPLVMTVPLTGSGLGFLDAWFEATSAITTTGLSTMATLDDKPVSFLFGRAWMQWYGGLGIVVLSLGLAMQPGVDARRLARTQSEEKDIVGSTREHARRMLILYSLLTALGILALLACGTGLFDAVIHCFTALSTGGFASRDGSLASFAWPVQLVVTVLSVVAAVPLHLMWLSSRRATGRLLRDPQWKWLLACAAATSALLFLVAVNERPHAWRQAGRDALVTGFSAQTTTGFSITNISDYAPGSKLILVASMAVGGGTGSTAGGFKVLRLLILFRALQLMVFRTTLPRHAAESSQFAGRQLSEADREEAFAVVTLFVLTVGLSWLPFVVAGYDPLDSLLEVVSATSMVGLSTGITAPELPGFLKGVLCVDMLLGRLEFLALLVLVYPRTWFGRRMQSS